MNFKPIASLALLAIALTATTMAPALANNNAYLNQLAMQYYMQNQAAAGRNTLYNPALAAGAVSTVVPTLVGSAAYGVTPVYGVNQMYGVNPAVAGITTAYGGPYSGMNSMVNPYNSYSAYNPALTSGVNALGINNYALSTAIAPKMNQLNQQAAQLQSQLAYSNNPWQANRIENKLAKIQAEETSLSTTGSPYMYSGGLLNSLRNAWHF